MIKKYWDAIPGWLFLTIIVGMAAIFIDPIMEILHKRKQKIDFDKMRLDAKIVCFRDDFPLERQRQACQRGRKLALHDKRTYLQHEFTSRLCRLDDAESCFEFYQIQKKQLPKEEQKRLLNKACRKGQGGNMEACGELGLIMKGENNALSKEYFHYACTNGFKRFCQ